LLRPLTVRGASEVTFWICGFLVVYTYFLYPVLLFLVYSVVQLGRDFKYLVRRRKRRAGDRDSTLPPVSLIIPAYNEQPYLPAKIKNVREIDYPADRLEVIFVSDGSTDGTNEILTSLQDSRIKTLFLPQRAGKANALNQGVSRSRAEILVFSDASTLFAPDVVRLLVRHFDDDRVGVVCGSVRLIGSTESRQTEGFYWRFESVLRLMETRLGATLNASGCVYAARRRCYRPLATHELIDDFSIPMNARKLGYRVIEDPEAVATEFSVESVRGEFARRIRLAIGSFGALKQVRGLPLFSFTSLAFFSHKLLRWILPFLLIGLLVSNAFLWASPFYRLVFAAQALFYLWAAAGFAFRNSIQRFRFALFGYFLVAIHVAFLIGFWRYLSGRTSSAWQKVN
jgi:cellulose synthase/poly-beta-1,6-N-acetylglucosamine synthase-like glycosyltransferase